MLRFEKKLPAPGLIPAALVSLAAGSSAYAAAPVASTLVRTCGPSFSADGDVTISDGRLDDRRLKASATEPLTSAVAGSMSASSTPEWSAPT